MPSAVAGADSVAGCASDPRAAPRKQCFDVRRQPLKVDFQRRRQSVEPVDAADKIIQRFGRRDIFYAQRHDGHALADRSFNFLWNVAGQVGLRGKNEHHDAALVYGVDDGFAVMNAGKNVARRDPAANPVGLQHGTDGVRHRLVARGVTDEYIMRHGRARSSPPDDT